MSPSSSAPQGALRRRPTLCLPLNLPRATGLMACLHHLNPKTVPWHQGARPRSVIHRARRLRVKKEAAKKSRGREKLHYLNPAPIHEIGERWISKYERTQLEALFDLKTALEEEDGE